LLDGPLHRLWPIDCLRRHPRRLAVAEALPPERSKELWQWAGLTWEDGRPVTEEAIVFVPPRAPGGMLPSAKFTVANATSGGSWPMQVDAFCAWCERQLLAPVAIFDAARAAALDNTFEWLLLLFAPRNFDETDRFPWEVKRLERFVAAAGKQDARYLDLLPVLVPVGGDEVATFRHDFGLNATEPILPMSVRSDAAVRSSCGLLQDALGGDAEDAAAAGSSRRRRAGLWATVLFNTHTRRKYLEPQNAAWTPGDEVALCAFVDNVLNGHLLPSFRSAPEGEDPRSFPAGVTELVGTTFGTGVVEPIVAGRAEVLLLLYAPWCSHSLNFFPHWNALAASIATDASAGQLLVAQMDATRNEHGSLPPVSRFPMVMLGVRNEGNATRRTDSLSFASGGASVTFLPYEGGASVDALQAWLTKFSAHFRQGSIE